MKSNSLIPEALNTYLGADVKPSGPIYTQEYYNELMENGYDVIDDRVVRKLSLKNEKFTLYVRDTQMSFHGKHLKACMINSGQKRGDRIFLPEFKRHTQEESSAVARREVLIEVRRPPRARGSRRNAN